MRKIMFLLRKSQRNAGIFMLLLCQIFLVVGYVFASLNLVKPAGLMQAAEFLFKMPGEYFLSFLMGILAWLISAGLLIAVVRELEIIKVFFDDDERVYYDDYHYEYFDDISKTRYIINAAVVVASIAINFVFLKGLGGILLLILLIVGAFFFYAMLSKA